MPSIAGERETDRENKRSLLNLIIKEGLRSDRNHIYNTGIHQPQAVPKFASVDRMERNNLAVLPIFIPGYVYPLFGTNIAGYSW